ncbi:MAG: hypothetical protein ABIP48_30215 [Planctomycetota bacterium]
MPSESPSPKQVLSAIVQAARDFIPAASSGPWGHVPDTRAHDEAERRLESVASELIRLLHPENVESIRDFLEHSSDPDLVGMVETLNRFASIRDGFCAMTTAQCPDRKDRAPYLIEQCEAFLREASEYGAFRGYFGSSMGSASQDCAVFKKIGETWTVGYGDSRQEGLKHVMALEDVQHLLANQGSEVGIADLPGNKDSQPKTRSVKVATKADGEKLLRQIKELQAERPKAPEEGKAPPPDGLLVLGEIQKETKELLREYNQNFDNRGHPRQLPGDQEKMVASAEKRYRRLLKKLKKSFPALASHLETNVTIGVECIYAPEHHVEWDLGD